MDNNSIQQMPTSQIITEMANLEKDIDMAILKYEYLRQEILRRFSQLIEEESFQDKYKTRTL